jgi:YVTN family beta-propeller protein
MYGPGFSRPGGDGCGLAGWDESFVYRIDTQTLEIDQIIPVGAVPKYLTVTPDDRYLLVANWCSFDVSVIEVETGEELARVEAGRHPRGIAVDPDSTRACRSPGWRASAPAPATWSWIPPAVSSS